MFKTSVADSSAFVVPALLSVEEAFVLLLLLLLVLGLEEENPKMGVGATEAALSAERREAVMAVSLRTSRCREADGEDEEEEEEEDDDDDTGRLESSSPEEEEENPGCGKTEDDESGKMLDAGLCWPKLPLRG